MNGTGPSWLDRIGANTFAVVLAIITAAITALLSVYLNFQTTARQIAVSEREVLLQERVQRLELLAVLLDADDPKVKRQNLELALAMDIIADSQNRVRDILSSQGNFSDARISLDSKDGYQPPPMISDRQARLFPQDVLPFIWGPWLATIEVAGLSDEGLNCLSNVIAENRVDRHRWREVDEMAEFILQECGFEPEIRYPAGPALFE